MAQVIRQVKIVSVRTQNLLDYLTNGHLINPKWRGMVDSVVPVVALYLLPTSRASLEVREGGKRPNKRTVNWELNKIYG